jgi:uncharacterized protein (DUF4415 family)
VLTPAQKVALSALIAIPDAEIDTGSLPEVQDWTGAQRGVSYSHSQEQLTLRLDSDLVDWCKTHTPGGGRAFRQGSTMPFVNTPPTMATKRRRSDEAVTTRSGRCRPPFQVHVTRVVARDGESDPLAQSQQRKIAAHDLDPPGNPQPPRLLPIRLYRVSYSEWGTRRHFTSASLVVRS